TKDELLKAVWADSFVEEGNLTQNVFLLRKALEQKSEHSGLIVTIPRKGYQFTAQVVTGPPTMLSADRSAGHLAGAAVSPGLQKGGDQEPQEPVATLPIPKPPRTKSRWFFAALASVATLIVLAGGYRWWQRSRTAPGTPPRRIMLAVLPLQNLTGDPE